MKEIYLGSVDTVSDATVDALREELVVAIDALRADLAALDARPIERRYADAAAKVLIGCGPQSHGDALGSLWLAEPPLGGIAGEGHSFLQGVSRAILRAALQWRFADARRNSRRRAEYVAAARRELRHARQSLADAYRIPAAEWRLYEERRYPWGIPSFVRYTAESTAPQGEWETAVCAMIDESPKEITT